MLETEKGLESLVLSQGRGNPVQHQWLYFCICVHIIIRPFDLYSFLLISTNSY